MTNAEILRDIDYWRDEADRAEQALNEARRYHARCVATAYQLEELLKQQKEDYVVVHYSTPLGGWKRLLKQREASCTAETPMT